MLSPNIETPVTRRRARSAARSGVTPSYGVSLETVLCTDELKQRSSRAPDYQTESRTLLELTRHLSDDPQTVLQKLTDAALDLCRAGSAGVSLISKETGDFYWPAISGRWCSQIGNGTPREFGPCGVVVDTDQAQLFQRPERVFPYLSETSPEITEALLSPFRQNGEPVGTVWVIAHDPDRRFDFEDLRLVESLCTFASAACQTLESLEELGQLNRQLRDSEERLNLALFAGGTGAWDWDVSRGQAQISQSYRDLFAVPEDQSFGYEDWLAIVHPEDRDRCRTYGETFFATATATEWNLEFRVVTPHRGIRWHRATGRVTRSADGQPERFVGVSTDVTERKQAEGELARLNRELREADRSKDEFLATLAHELRNPLAPIRSGLEVMKLANGEPAIVDEVVSTMERQSRQLIRLVDDLLDVSRITQGRLELKKCRVELAQVIKSAVEASEPFIHSAGHNLTVEMPGQALYVNADPHRLAQVVSNLLNNAARYTPEGGHIRLSVEREDDAGVISVTDDGIGIPADMLGRIFDKFTQLGRHSHRGSTGLGIGLTLVKSLVERHEGTVEVHSEGENRGSQFRVRLPLQTD